MSVAKKAISIASAEVGYREGRNANGSYNNHQKYSPAVPSLEWSQNQAWCQTFQSWVALKAGSASYEPRTASCRVATDWFKARKRFSYYPAIGAQVFFGSGGGSHVGRVYKYDATYVWTIEGNTNDSGSAEGNGVYLKKRTRKDSYLHGYGLPAFPEGITTADPALKGKSGYHYKATASAPVSSGSGGSSSGGASGGSGVARYTVTIDGKKYGYGANGAHVTTVGKALVARGFGKHYKEGPGPNWTDADTKNYADYQKSLGYKGADADGVPGSSSLAKLLGKASGGSATVTVDLSDLVKAARSNPSAKGQPVTYSGVKVVEKALQAEGLLSGTYVDGHFGTTTVAAYAAYQRNLGYQGKDADGIPGSASLKKLGAKHGFKVRG
ncbi:peptidoglycan-binding protein [Streptomyces sp. AJS327]|uniref:peptidoglycan-binding protein n=1 Tax=Streptomyces sp. AJS327 TaxID=2545265 RepID=UPI0015DEDB38|nr:peptidoglycan-binding protein [Streptomyces sp. AJS327]MBA0054304.1 peptidoglycan-binding protein [Streptomyces sp. AJS327]